MENLRKLVKGIEITHYQRSLAINEFIEIERRLKEHEKGVKTDLQNSKNLFPTYEEMRQMAFNFRPQRGNLGVFWRDGFRECYLWLNELIKKS